MCQWSRFLLMMFEKKSPTSDGDPWPQDQELQGTGSSSAHYQDPRLLRRSIGALEPEEIGPASEVAAAGKRAPTGA